MGSFWLPKTQRSPSDVMQCLTAKIASTRRLSYVFSSVTKPMDPLPTSLGDLSLSSCAFAGAPLCLCVLDARGCPVEANALFQEQIGELYKLSGRTFELIGACERDVARLRNAFDETLRTGQRSKVRDVSCFVLGGGFPCAKHMDWSVSRLTDARGSLCLAGELVAEVDEPRRERDAELLDFFQNAPIAMHWLSGDGTILWANNTELRVLGYAAEEYIGQPIMKFCPDDSEIVLEIFKSLGSGASIKDVPVRVRAKDGRIVPLLIDSNVNYTKSGEFNHTRCFIRDDTGRKVQEASTKLMVRELKRSKELFDAVVSRTMHLVRTPCHIVLADLDRLQMGELDATEVDGVLRGAMHLLEDVASMTCDVSDVMRFEQGAELEVHRQPTDLLELGKACVDLALPLVCEGASLCFDCGAGCAQLQTDGVVLKRVLAHLLKNACAATSKGAVTLRVVRHSCAGVTISVEDSGKGLEMSTLQFVQRYSDHLEQMTLEAASIAREKLEADLRLNSGNEGLGVGLLLSYWLVQTLGAELQGESVLGQGTKFWFDLTRDADGGWDTLGEVYKPPQADPADARRSDSAACSTDRALATGCDCAQPSRIVQILGERRQRPWSSEDPEPQSPSHAKIVQCGVFESTKVPHVLIVEDSPLCAKVLSKMLQRAGYTSETASDGALAVATLRTCVAHSPYDLVLMDLRMPVMDGFEATRIAKRDLGLGIPIVALTAESSFDIREKCDEAGFDDLRTKPITIRVLRKLLEKYIPGQTSAAQPAAAALPPVSS